MSISGASDDWSLDEPVTQTDINTDFNTTSVQRQF